MGQFFWADIPDLGVAKDKAARSAAETIIRKLKAGEICYVHCWGGNGRTGTILSIVLARLYASTHRKQYSTFRLRMQRENLLSIHFQNRIARKNRLSCWEERPKVRVRVQRMTSQSLLTHCKWWDNFVRINK